jgi:acyl-CoA thioesterase FadM
MAKEFWVNRNAGPINLGEFHISNHICWPWDLDLWLELNNGRTLTLYDLGRLVLFKRYGLLSLSKTKRWSMPMAGASVRYRKRIRVFERFEMRSRGLCWDDRFFYIEQSIWKKNGECAGHIVYRSAFADSTGIINPDKVIQALDVNVERPQIPNWIASWIEAENNRPWPPDKE